MGNTTNKIALGFIDDTNNGSLSNPILPSTTTGGANPGVSFLKSAVPAAISLILVVGVAIFFFMFVVGAIKWISSGGDKQSLETARGSITNALVGLVIMFAVFAILQLIQHFFGISIMTLDISKLVIQ